MRWTDGVWAIFVMWACLASASAGGGIVASVDYDVDLVLGAPGDEAEYFFGDVSSVVEDSDGNIYVADNDREQVFKFTADGGFIGAMGQLGDGPGDLRRYFLLAIDGQDRLYAAGMGGDVEIVDTAWNYIDTFTRINPGSIPGSIAVLPDRGVVITAVSTARHTTLDLYDASFEHLRSFSDTYAVGTGLAGGIESVFAGGRVVVEPGGTLLYAQNAPYLLRRFDCSGVLRDSTDAGGRDFVAHPPMPEVEGGSVLFRFESMTSGLAVIRGGDIVVSAVQFGDDGARRSLFCVYDEDLTLIGRREWEDAHTVVGLSRNGRVYITRRTDDGYEVVRATIRSAGGSGRGRGNP